MSETVIEKALTDIMGEVQALQATDTGTFLVDPTTSEAIKAILFAEKAVKQAKEIMVERLRQQALEYDPAFKGIQGNGVRASYKATGAAFTVVDPKKLLDNAPSVLKTTFGVDSKALKAWQKQNGGASVLPAGVEPITERTMSLSFSLAGSSDEQED